MQVGYAEIAILSQYRRSLLMAKDDEEMYDKKLQRYTEGNAAVSNCKPTQW